MSIPSSQAEAAIEVAVAPGQAEAGAGTFPTPTVAEPIPAAAESPTPDPFAGIDPELAALVQSIDKGTGGEDAAPVFLGGRSDPGMVHKAEEAPVEAAPAPEAQAPVAEPTPAPAVDPAASPSPAAPEAAAPAPAEPPAPAAPAVENPELPARIRTSQFKNETDRKALALLAEGVATDLTHALQILKQAEPAAPAAPAPKPSQVETVETEITALETAHAAALKNFDTDKATELSAQIRAADRKLVKAQEADRVAREQESSVSAWQADYDRSVERAAADFPQAADKGSMLYKLVAGEFALMDPKSPEARDPEVAYKVTERLAKELGVAKKGAASSPPAPPVVPAPPATPPAPAAKVTTPKAPIPASGAVRVASVPQKPEDKAKAHMEGMLGPEYAGLMDAAAKP